VHVTNNKENLDELEVTNQSVILGSSKVMAAQFKGRKTIVLANMTGV